MIQPDDPMHGKAPSVDPWAPGGVMSDPGRWNSPEALSAPGVDPGGDGSPPTSRISRLGVGLVGVVVVSGLAVTGWWMTRDDSPARPAAVSDRDDESVVNASVGRIAWERVVGDVNSLPASIVAGADGGLLGRDDSGALSWISVDGSEWDGPRGDVGDLELAGVRWSVDIDDGHRRLVLDAAGESMVAPVVDPEPVGSGMDVSWEVRGAAARDVLVEVEGLLFARLDRREEVDWRALLGIESGDGYRVHVVGDDIDETFASGDGSVPVESVELTARATVEGVSLSDEDGRELGVVNRSDAKGDVRDALTATVASAWAGWDGARFHVVASPWSSSDIVEVAAVGDRAIAVATIKLDAGRRAWTTGDGVNWEPAELPVEPSDASPLPITIGGNEVALSISDGSTTTYWSTTDAVNFEPLPQIPGINRRSQGSFGWIAPDPRSSPLLRISPDGNTWTELDLSEQLGYDAARWDGHLDAIAIGDEIYITSTIGEQRTVLIGNVDAASASS